MRRSWEEKPLGEICHVLNGLWKGQKPPFVTAGVIRNTNFTKDCTLDDSDVIQLPVEKRRFDSRRLQYGDLILEKSGGGPKQPVGRAVLYAKDNGNVSFSNFTSVLRIVDQNRVDPRFLHKFLLWTYLSGATETMQSHSTGIRNLNMAAYKAIRVGLPPLAEQRRIVDILDKAFAAIATAKAKTEQNLQNARALLERELASIFTRCGASWVSAKIGDPIRFIDYRGRTPKKTDTGLRLITAKNVKMGYLQRTPEEFVAPSSYKTWMTRGIPQFGDVLFTTEAPLANVAQLDTNEKVVFAQRIIVMQPDRARLEPTFLKYLLLSPPVQQRIRAKGTGATVQGIKARLLKEIPISFPPTLAEQAKVVARLNSLQARLSTLESACSHKLLLFDELKKSLLREAFAGVL